MGLFGGLFGKKSNTSSRSTPNAYVMETARAFISMCKKIDALGKIGFGINIIKEETPYGATNFYIKHTFRDVDLLLFAQDALQSGKSEMVEYYYDRILKQAQLTPREQGFFLQDLSDFCDFLRGGIPNSIQSTRDGSNLITVVKSLGICSRSEATSTYTALIHLV